MTNEEIRDEYARKETLFEQLRAEIVFTLDGAIKQSDIKIDTIESRVKALDSLIAKSDDKIVVDPFVEINDLVAARVICLFRSSLDDVDKLIEENFNVISKDDKVSQSDAFGYMSVHYICSIKSDHTGPRYDKLKDTKFEIQVRTLCMHAWASVSHYLTYKSQWDVPNNLKKAFSALSGLFYVADDQFEQLFRERLNSQTNAIEDLQKNAPNIAINKDTIEAVIISKFPDRPKSTEESLSSVTEEISASGYANVGEIERDIDRSSKALVEWDKQQEAPLTGVGALRISLGIANRKYRELKYAKSPAKMQKYAKYIVD